MKLEELENLEVGTLVYDKTCADDSGEPLTWEIASPVIRAKHNPDYFMRQINLLSQTNDESQLGYQVLTKENVSQVTRDKTVARLYITLNEIENTGRSTSLIIKLEDIIKDLL